jgi:hypothetical protein
MVSIVRKHCPETFFGKPVPPIAGWQIGRRGGEAMTPDLSGKQGRSGSAGRPG